MYANNFLWCFFYFFNFVYKDLLGTDVFGSLLSLHPCHTSLGRLVPDRKSWWAVWLTGYNIRSFLTFFFFPLSLSPLLFCCLVKVAARCAGCWANHLPLNACTGVCPSDGKRMRAVFKNTLCTWTLFCLSTDIVVPHRLLFWEITLGREVFIIHALWSRFPVDNKSWLYLVITSQPLVVEDWDLL